jgi:RNA polymerase sigma-70 factor (ECF subfamily)
MTAVLVRPASPTPTTADEALVRDIRAGDDRAFALLVRRHEAALVGFAAGVLGGAHHDAEECVQDAFVRALAFLRAHPDREIAVKPWLYTIVRNVCVDRLRKGRGTVTLDGLDAVLADGAAGPYETAHGREQLRLVVGALHALPARQRQALVMHELEGRPHEEMAPVLGVSVGGSKALVCRARRGMAQARQAA